MRPSGVAWCVAAEGVPPLCAPAPGHCRCHQTPPRSASGSLPRPLPKGLRVVLSLPFANALTATVQDLKTACPLPSCGRLKELPPALTHGKKKKRKEID